MKRLVLCLIPMALLGSAPRFARLGELEGTVEVQLHAADAWRPAQRNLALLDGAWIRTAAGARAEIELDEGNVIRLAPDSLCEISDYSRLSTGQRVTLISIDRGTAYFTGETSGKDSLVLGAPGAQVSVGKGSRVRIEAGANTTQVASLEGSIRFSAPVVELDLKEGQTVKVDAASLPSGRFYLYREIVEQPLDRWNEERDKFLAASISARHTGPLKYGTADLDAAGAWLDTAEFGSIWKPKTAQGWAPFRNGKWIWYDELGYTWTSADTWGWLPYHYGRWMQKPDIGWFWVPPKRAVFKPGDVYWLRGSNFIGWGPLAPDEAWEGSGLPRLFMNANTTYAKFEAEAHEIDSAGFSIRPTDPLATAKLVAALPSPAVSTARWEVLRPVLRAGSTRVVPVLPGVTYEAPPPVPVRASVRAPESAVQEPPPAYPIYSPSLPAQPAQPQPQPIVVAVPPQEREIEVFYPAPVYTGIVVVNPPERNHTKDRDPHRKPPSAQSPAAPPAPQPAPQPALTGMPRRSNEERRSPRQEASPPEQPPQERNSPETPRGDRGTRLRTNQ